MLATAVLAGRYLRYALSYRDLEEIMRERGLHVDHTTIYRWVQHYAPELEKRCRQHLKATNDSWRVDETSVKIKKTWMYLYRAVDSEGNTLEFLREFLQHSLHSGAGFNDRRSTRSSARVDSDNLMRPRIRS